MAQPDAAVAKSAAWLLAEGAFAARPPPAQAVTAVVTVRRSRIALAESGPEAEPAQTPSAEEKGPRVFRIDTAPAPVPVPADSPDPAAEPEAPAPRQRRIASDKRPGPVLQVFSAPPADSTTGSEAALSADIIQPPLRTARLAEVLGEVDTVLADIRKARSFRFIGP